MVDFKKLSERTPEERQAARDRLDAEFKAKEQRIKLMVDKLCDQSARGHIDNTWVEEFIESVRVRVSAGLPLSDKQQTKLEELFEQY